MAVSRRTWTILALALGGLAGAVLLWSPSEERRIEGVLREMVGAVGTLPGDTEVLRRARIEAVFAAHVLPQSSFAAPDLGRLGSGEVRSRLEALGSAGLDVELDQVDVSVTGSGAARVSALGTLEVTVLDGRYRDRRPITVELVERAGKWKILRVTAEARSRAQPEARP